MSCQCAMEAKETFFLITDCSIRNGVLERDKVKVVFSVFNPFMCSPKNNSVYIVCRFRDRILNEI